MFFYEGQSCPVCKQHFGENDDIVACPICGAPHHRDCWKAEGHCHFAADHGTERQWAKGASDEPVKNEPTPKQHCQNCGAENPEFAEFCSHCGRELNAAAWQSAPPPRVHHFTPPHGGFVPPRPVGQDPFGGIPRTDTIDGVSVETIAEVLGPNSTYYLPRFLHMHRTGKKISWNWAAFLLSYNWLLYRKNMVWGWFTFAFVSVINYFQSDVALQLEKLLPNLAQMMMDGTLPSNFGLLMSVGTIASLVILAVHVILGLFGNWIYMQNVMKKARALQENPNLQYSQNFLSTGGTSLAMAFLPELLLTFVQYVILLLSL